MENKLNELEARKAELEQAFESKKKQLQQLEVDILLMQQLMSAKSEHKKLTDELNEIIVAYRTVNDEMKEVSKDNPAEEKDKE